MERRSLPLAVLIRSPTCHKTFAPDKNVVDSKSERSVQREQAALRALFDHRADGVNVPLAAYTAPPLTSVDQPTKEQSKPHKLTGH